MSTFQAGDGSDVHIFLAHIGPLNTKSLNVTVYMSTIAHHMYHFMATAPIL